MSLFLAGLFYKAASVFTWNPTDKDSHMVLGNGNRDSLSSTVNATFCSVRVTTGKSLGKWYAEISVVSPTSASPTSGFGLGDAAFPLNSYLGNSGNAALVWFANGNTISNGVTVVNAVTGATAVDGDYWMLAYDATAGKAWVGLNGSWLNGGDPAAGTNPWITWTPSSSWFVGATQFNTADHATLRLAATLSGTAPSGFTALNA